MKTVDFIPLEVVLLNRKEEGEMGTTREEFAKNLRYYMEKNDMVQTDIMTLTGASQSAVSDWVTGKKFPRVDKIEILAERFGIEKSDLIEEKNEDTERDIAILSRTARNMTPETREALLNVAKALLDGGSKK